MPQEQIKLFAAVRERCETDHEFSEIVKKYTSDKPMTSREWKILHAQMVRAEVESPLTFGTWASPEQMAARKGDNGMGNVYEDLGPTQRVNGNRGNRETVVPFVTRDGQVLRGVRRGAKIDFGTERVNRDQFGGGIGDVVVAALKGDQNKLRDMGITGLGSVGGYSVGSTVLSDIIEKSRAASVLDRAGATTVPLPAGASEFVICKISERPTCGWYGENVAITATDPTLEAAYLRPKTLAVMVKLSYEMVMDSLDAQRAVEQAITNSLALEMDRAALYGSGAGSEPEGLFTFLAAGYRTGSIGAIAYEDLITACVAVQSENYTPTGFIINPTIMGDLAALRDDGATGGFLVESPFTASIPKIVSTTCQTSEIFCGDWSQFIIGMRGDANLKISEQAGDSFEKKQVWVRLLMRMDFNTNFDAAFHVLEGVTT